MKKIIIDQSWGDKHDSTIWINIRKMTNGRLVGDDVDDKDKLMLCGCPIYFNELELPEIVKAVSLHGFGLRTGDSLNDLLSFAKTLWE